MIDHSFWHSFKFKFGLLFLVIISPLVGLGLFADQAYQRVISETDAANAVQDKQHYLTSEIQRNFQSQVKEWKNVLLRGGRATAYPEHLGKFYEFERAVRLGIKGLEPVSKNNPAIMQTILNLKKEHREAGKKYRRALRIYNSPDQTAHHAADEMTNDADKRTEEVIGQLIKVIDLEWRKRIALSREEAGEAEDLVAIVFFSVMLIVVALLSLLLRRGILKPIGEAVEAAQTISSGNLDQEINVERKDEMGALLNSLEIMRWNLLASKVELEEEIIQRKDIEDNLRKSQDQLLHSEKLAATGKLSASIAHEFNNPLYAIKNVLEEVHEGVEMNAPYKELVEIGIKECNRIAGLIHNLRVFHQPSPGLVEFIDLHQEIDDIVFLMKKKFKEKRIDLNLEYAGDLPKVGVIPDQFKQVVLNLLQNAEESFTSEKGKITIATELVDSVVRIHFEDTGQGIAPENMKHIFDPFFTTKSDAKGTGLGLSICHGIIKALGGDILVESQLGKGTKMTLAFPVNLKSKEAVALPPYCTSRRNAGL